MEHTIDAKGKKLGRVASEAASYLMGKKTAQFVRNKVLPIKVTITNVSKLDIAPKKRATHPHYRHSQYRGGLKMVTTEEFIVKKGYKELMRKTVYGMLPTNKLRREMIKNLMISE